MSLPLIIDCKTIKHTLNLNQLVRVCKRGVVNTHKFSKSQAKEQRLLLTKPAGAAPLSTPSESDVSDSSWLLASRPDAQFLCLRQRCSVLCTCDVKPSTSVSDRPEVTNKVPRGVELVVGGDTPRRRTHSSTQPSTICA